MHTPPGTEQSRRGLRYELITCGVSGHHLVGTDAAELRDEDRLFAREGEHGTRWHRCLRCDSWLALPRPERPARRHPPPRDEIELPLRGKALRDKYVLRLIAIDRFLHFGVLSVIAAAIFLFATHRTTLSHSFYRVLTDIQGGVGGPTHNTTSGGFLGEIHRAFTLRTRTLEILGGVALGYGLLEAVEGFGLWWQQRWAEYLTFIATTVLLPLEVYELTGRVSVFKVLALIVNVAVVVYLIYAKRLFGLRGGGRAEERERRRDVGWEALERTAPPSAVPA
jgi:uncharacterized membrane protein (DUF2068 family)